MNARIASICSVASTLLLATAAGNAAEILVDANPGNLVRPVGDTVWFDTTNSNVPIPVTTINGAVPSAGVLDGWAHTRWTFTRYNAGAVSEIPSADKSVGQANWLSTGANQLYSTGSAGTTVTADKAVGFLETLRDFRINNGVTVTVNNGGVMWHSVSHYIRDNAGSAGELTTGLASGELFLIANGGSTDYAVSNVRIVDNGGTPTIVVKGGPDRLRLRANTVPHTYTGGTIVNNGELEVFGPNSGQSSVGTGTLTINEDGTVTASSHNVFGNAGGADLIPIVINGGTLNPAQYNHLNSITMTGGTINQHNSNGGDGLDMRTRTGVLPTVTTNASANQATIAAKTTLRNDTTFNVADGAAATDLQHSGQIVGSANFIKDGDGTMHFSSGKAYTGSTTIDGGRLRVTSSLHNTSSITVNSGATLEIDATNVFLPNHTTAMPASREITVDGGTWTSTSGVSRVGNVNLDNGATWAVNVTNGTWGNYYLGELSDTSSATVAVGGTSASAITGTGNIKLGVNTNFDVADVTSNSAVDLSVAATLEDQPSSFGAGGLTKKGAGTMELTGTHTYSGATSVEAGTLEVTGSIANSTVTVGANGTLSGAGTVGGQVLSGGTIAPGDSPGTMNVAGNAIWNDGTFEFEIDSATGTAGTDWDLDNITGSLDLTGLTSMEIDVISQLGGGGDVLGPLANFDPYQNYTWTFATAAGGITGFDAGDFSVDASLFGNNNLYGSFSVEQDGNNLNLVHHQITIPEPSSLLLVALGVMGLGLIRPRRRVSRGGSVAVAVVAMSTLLVAGNEARADRIIGVNFNGGNFSAHQVTNVGDVFTLPEYASASWTDVGAGGAAGAGDRRGTNIALNGAPQLELDYLATNPWQSGRQGDTDQQLYRGYLDDGDNGRGQANTTDLETIARDNDGYGVAIRITGLAAWLKAEKAGAYIVRPYFNTDSSASIPLHPLELVDGTLVTNTDGSDLAAAALLESVSATTTGNGRFPTNSTSGGQNDNGTRGFGDSSRYSLDNLVLRIERNETAARVDLSLVFVSSPFRHPNPLRYCLSQSA